MMFIHWSRKEHPPTLYFWSNFLYRVKVYLNEHLPWSVCCCLYCECAARVTMPTATHKCFFFPGIAWYCGDNDFIIRPSISLHVLMQRTWLVLPDMDSHMNCSTDRDSHVTCSKRYGVYKLYTAAMVPHLLTFALVRCMIIFVISMVIYNTTCFNVPWWACFGTS